MKKFIIMFMCAVLAFTAGFAVYAQDDTEILAAYDFEKGLLTVSGKVNSESAVTLYVLNNADNISELSDSNPPAVCEITKADSKGNFEKNILLPETMKSGIYNVYAYFEQKSEKNEFIYFGKDLDETLDTVNSALSEEEIKDEIDKWNMSDYADFVAKRLYVRRNGGYDAEALEKEFISAEATAKIIDSADTKSTVNKYKMAFCSEEKSTKYDVSVLLNSLSETAAMQFLTEIRNANFEENESIACLLSRAAVLASAKSAQNKIMLKNAILGTDYDGNKVNNAFAVINPDTSYYDKLVHKDEVFAKMYENIGEIKTFEDIARLFKETAEKEYSSETAKESGGSSSSGGGSGSSSGGTPPQIISGITANKTDEIKLSDIENHWAREQISALCKKGIIKGYPNNTFCPDNEITRAEFIAITVRAFDIQNGTKIEINDVPENMWCYNAAAAALNAKIINGYPNGNIEPDGLITREDAAVILHRILKDKYTLSGKEKKFADMSECADYAEDAVKEMSAVGIINGTDKNHFSPKQKATRAEVAALVVGVMDYAAAH